MSLAELLNEEVRLFKKKKEAYSKYLSSKDRINELIEETHSTWEDYQKKKEYFDKLYGSSTDTETLEDRIWADYLTKAKKNDRLIKDLAKKKKIESDCFRKFNKIGSDHMKSGHRKKGQDFFRRANEHLAKSKKYEGEIKELHNNNHRLRIEAEEKSEYNKLKAEVKTAKRHHLDTKEKLREAREDRNVRKRYYHRSKNEFENAQRKIQEWKKCHT